MPRRPREVTVLEVNQVGDRVLRNPQAMRALADPERLALHDILRRGGPATVTELSSLLESEPRTIAEHLEAFEKVGLVECVGPSRWAAIGKGIYFEIPDDPDGQRAARQLSNVMFLQYADAPRRWVSHDEPNLALEWLRAAGLLNVRLLVTSDELRQLQEDLEGLFEPFVRREPAAVPSGTAHVHILSYFMPESG